MRTVNKKVYKDLEVKFERVEKLNEHTPKTITTLGDMIDIIDKVPVMAVLINDIRDTMQLCGEDYSKIDIPIKDCKGMTAEAALLYRNELIGAFLFMQGEFSTYKVDSKIPGHILSFIEKNNPSNIMVVTSVPGAFRISSELKEKFPKSIVCVHPKELLGLCAEQGVSRDTMLIYENFRFVYYN